MTAGNEAGVVFFVYTYACTLSIGFVLLCNGVLGSQAANLTFFMLNLNSVLNLFFPASMNTIFFFRYHTSITPALYFALHAGSYCSQ